MAHDVDANNILRPTVIALNSYYCSCHLQNISNIRL